VALTLGSFALSILFSTSGFVLSKGTIMDTKRKETIIVLVSLCSMLRVLSFLCFMLSGSTKKWWIWGFWISPMMYGQNAMVINEFLGNKWKHVSFFHYFICSLSMTSLSYK